MPRHPTRQIELLKLIARFGVLNTKHLWILSGKSIKMDNLNTCLHELEAKKLISIARLQSYGMAHYWMIRKSEDSISKISTLTGQSRAYLWALKTREVHYPVEGMVPLFQSSIERHLPNLKVIRENKHGYPSIEQNILPKSLDRQFCRYPDLCVGVYSGVSQLSWVAIEFERFQMNPKRLLRRLNAIKDRSGFEGALIMLPDDSFLESHLAALETWNRRQAASKTHSRPFAVAFSLIQKDLFKPDQITIWGAKNQQTIESWILGFAQKILKPHLQSDRHIGGLR